MAGKYLLYVKCLLMEMVSKVISTLFLRDRECHTKVTFKTISLRAVSSEQRLSVIRVINKIGPAVAEFC